MAWVLSNEEVRCDGVYSILPASLPDSKCCGELAPAIRRFVIFIPGQAVKTKISRCREWHQDQIKEIFSEGKRSTIKRNGVGKEVTTK